MKKTAELIAFLRSNKRINLPALEETERKACEFVGKLLVNGESNSVLILGPEGCGKTTVVQAARRKCLLSDESFAYNPVVIDVQAVKSIVKQIVSNDCLKFGHEKPAYVETSSVQTYGLIFAQRPLLVATINVLEVAEVKISDVIGLQNVVELLERHNAKNKAAIVVIIEEFDMLTTTTYQRLLYSFLDMSQRGVVPVLLFGLSRRMDVVDLLEKRIRSRLSHIQLCPFGELSFEKYCESVKEYLLIPENSKKASSIEKSWNRDVLECMECQEVLNTLAKVFRSSKTIGRLSTFLDIAIRRVLNCDEGLTEAFQFAYNLLNGSTEFEYLEGLSVLELTILLGLANLEETQKDDQRINFKMLQKHVTAFIQKKCRYICQDKEQLTQAFQRLRKLELIVSPGRTTDKDHTMIEFQPLVLQVEAHTLRRFLRQASVPVPVRQWAECIDI